jgi:DNA ligase-1
MKRFAALFAALDATTRRTVKQAALVEYFRAAPRADAAWALHLLTGRKLMRALPSQQLRRWSAEHADLPPWLIDECYDRVGDLAETLALLVPQPGPGTDLPLSTFIEQRILPLRTMTLDQQREAVVALWSELDTPQCFLMHKLMAGAFRVGVAQRTVVQALAEVADLPPAVIAHRLMGAWEPTAAALDRLLDPAAADVAAHQPYPFMLAAPWESPLAELGHVADWQIEWKWDGVRAQLIRRGDCILLWSRGEELMDGQFPELIASAGDLPHDAVLDGEVLAWENGAPLAFHWLQRRLNRKRVTPTLFPDVPVIFMAYDLLECDGTDLRSLPLTERRDRLVALVEEKPVDLMQVSPVLPARDWDDVAESRAAAARTLREGVMLKRRDLPYTVGRQQGTWWKLKCVPRTLDAVMTAAQPGHGKRATLFTDYTFAVWDGDELVTIAKAYSGLTDAEIREVDAFVRRHTIARRGPVRVVEPLRVFELAFDGLQPSARHKSGVALRFPRIARIRDDKKPRDADTLTSVRALMRSGEGRS